MLISKFDLYKSEWLELVFDDRNKTYGAYELRQHNGRTMATAMAIAFTAIAVPLILVTILTKPIPMVKPVWHIVPVPLMPIVQPPAVEHPKPITHHTPLPAIAPVAPTAMHQFVAPVPSPDPLAQEPPTKTELESGAIGPITVKGPTGPPTNVPVMSESGPGTSNDPVPFTELQRMPEPVGGATAWGKFLNKNLKYPDMAIDQHMSGKVWVSFIVEKDGHLSNIVVDRGSGYGMDEEALRVLKLAPAWKPGIQNGQPVRVKYNIPINFQIGDDN